MRLSATELRPTGLPELPLRHATDAPLTATDAATSWRAP